MACPCPGARLLTLLDSHGQGRNGLRQRRFRGQPARDRQDTVGEPAAVVHEATLLAGWIGKRAGGLGGNAGRWVDLEAGGRGGHGQVDRPAGRQAGRWAGSRPATQEFRHRQRLDRRRLEHGLRRHRRRTCQLLQETQPRSLHTGFKAATDTAPCRTNSWSRVFTAYAGV